MKNPVTTTLLVAFLAAAGMGADLASRTALAGAGLYAVAVLVASFLPHRRWIFLAAGVCSALALSAEILHLQVFHAAPSWYALFNRGVTLAAIWLVAAVGQVVPWLRTQTALTESQLGDT